MLLRKLIAMRYSDLGNIRKYILVMSHTISKLKTLKIDLSDDLVVLYLVLMSLSSKFIQFDMSYNYQKNKWTVNELISYLVQEEERTR
jgi:hypothetical protein